MTPPRASNQESLWRQSCWVGDIAGLLGWRKEYAVNAVLVVDQAILKMMGKGDE